MEVYKYMCINYAQTNGKTMCRNMKEMKGPGRKSVKLCHAKLKFERRRNESEDFRNKFLEERNRKGERILKDRIEKKRRLKENVSL